MKIKKLFLILIIFLLIISLCEGDNRKLTFYEENNLSPRQIVTYSDNTIVFRLIERLNSTCNAPNLTYRILYPNGSNKLITVNEYEHQISSFNFCSNGVQQTAAESNQIIDRINFINTITNYVLVLYIKTINDTDLMFGMMIDWNGKITSNTLTGQASLFSDHSLTSYIDEDGQYNYLNAEKIENNYNRTLKRFKIFDNGKVDETQDIIQMPEGYKDVYAYANVDSNILFIFIYESENDTLQDFALEPKWMIYGSMLQKDSNQLSEQFLIYQTSISQYNSVVPLCDKFYDGNGFFCDLFFESSLENSEINPNVILPVVKVTFLSNGKITGTGIDFNIIDFDSKSAHNQFTLKSGGVIVFTVHKNITLNSEYCDINLYLLGSTNSFNTTTHSDLSCFNNVFTPMGNGTGLIFQEIKENSWTLSFIDFPILMKDEGYNNPIINWTTPYINGSISVGTTQIQIAYNVPITCSSQNISIYQQVDDGDDILRETYSGESNNCQISSDNITLLSVLPSTFNQPNSKYYVKIDANFVKQSNTLEPLIGIPKYKWIFSTEPYYYDIDDPVRAFIRLTPNATLYFKGLSPKRQLIFSQNLISQLAEVVPMPDNRITTDGHFQIDSTALSQVLIPINILEPNDTSVINVATIVETLNIMIENKERTLISRNNLTSMLDETYGLKVPQTFLEFITIPVIVIGSILLILSICYIWAYMRYKKGNNFVVIINALIVYDFITSILFMFDLKTKHLTLLFWISLSCTIPPMLINLFAAFYIISKENLENPKFYEYFIKNQALVSICSILSGADIEALGILSSEFAGFNIFMAPISEQAEKYIFWYSLFGLCFRDIPQFSLQIAYSSSRIEYTLIPILSLISDSLKLLNNIIGTLYFVIIKCKNLPSFAENNTTPFSQIERDTIF